MNILLSIDTVQLWILQTIINHEGHEEHEGSIYVLDFIVFFFVPFVSFVVISRFMCRLNKLIDYVPDLFQGCVYNEVISITDYTLFFNYDVCNVR